MEHCHGTPRSFVLELTCSSDEYLIPEEEQVYEGTACVYRVPIDSIYGCPTECGMYRGRLCAARGLCKFDQDTLKPHCYCQVGYTGYSCTEKGDNKSEGFTNTTLILLVVLVLLLMVEGGVILMWNKVKRLRLDPSAYTHFANADELA